MVYQPLSEKLQSKPQGKQTVMKQKVVYASPDTVLLVSQTDVISLKIWGAWIQGNQKWDKTLTPPH